MSDGYNFQQLKSAILPLSRASDWESAKAEWSLHSIIQAETPERCLCGHFPIIEICTIKNRMTGMVAEVGNVCVKRFLGIRSDLVFAALKRIQSDIDKSLNGDAATFFFESNAINEWEYGFISDTMRKRDLTERQLATRRKINRKVIAAVERRGIT